MKYAEPKDQTLALLRAVVSEMGRHDAAANPLAYAVFYERLAGINPGLTRAFDDALQATPRLDDATVERLFRRHVAEVGADDTDRIQRDMQRLMSDMAASAARTGSDAGRFGEQLGGLTGALSGALSGALQAGDVRQVGEQVQRTLQSTQAMQHSVATLQAQIAESRHEIERLREDLVRTREEATLCPMTRVLNRRGFDQKLADMLRERPPRGASHCLILLDIDHFKRVNDNHGHTVGDRVIAGLGEVLRSVPREPGMACARYGGEEFAVLLPATTLPRATQVAEAVRTRARAMRLRDRQTREIVVQVTVSAGVAAWQPGEDEQAFVACADAALYRSKETGRDRVTVA